MDCLFIYPGLQVDSETKHEVSFNFLAKWDTLIYYFVNCQDIAFFTQTVKQITGTTIQEQERKDEEIMKKS